MTFLLPGPKVYKLPASLSEYLQKEAASGLSYLTIIPFAFPVFVMNPFSYTENFKDILTQLNTKLNDSTLSGAPVPEGEVWMITNIVAASSGAAAPSYLRLAKPITGGGTQYLAIKYDSLVQSLSWSGQIWLTEGEFINAALPLGNLWLHVLGMKKHA